MYNSNEEKIHSMRSVTIKSGAMKYVKKVEVTSLRRVVIVSKSFSAISRNNTTVKRFMKKPSINNIEIHCYDDLRNLIEKKKKEKAARSGFKVKTNNRYSVHLMPKETVLPTAKSKKLVNIAEKVKSKINFSNTQYKSDENDCTSSDSLDSSDSSESETKKARLNKCLQSEKMQNINMMKTDTTTKINKTETEQYQPSNKCVKTTEMLVDTFTTPDLWKEEHSFNRHSPISSDTIGFYTKDCDTEIFLTDKSNNLVNIAEKVKSKNNFSNPQYKNYVNDCNSSDLSDSLDSSNSSDSETQTARPNRRPNRRLQAEKMQNIDMMKTDTTTTNKTVTERTINKTETEQNQPSNKCVKASEMWVDILTTPDLWKEEHSYKSHSQISSDTIGLYTNDCETEMDYQAMLNNFEEENNTLYEKRSRKKPLQHGFTHLISEFYIPPAQVEVFCQELTDDFTARECLKRVCAARRWPKPLYVQVNRPECKGFIFSCKLKMKKFTPKKSASNSHLAKELAASECLDYLGIKQRRSDASFCDLSCNSYFKY